MAAEPDIMEDFKLAAEEGRIGGKSALICTRLKVRPRFFSPVLLPWMATLMSQLVKFALILTAL